MKRETAQKKITILLLILGLIITAMLGRLAYLQLVQTQRYETLARENMVRIIPIPAPRGEIIDTQGKVLVNSKPVYTVSLSFFGISSEKQQEVEKLLARILSGDNNLPLSAAEWRDKIEEKLNQQNVPYMPVKIASGVSWETVVEVRERQLQLTGVIVEEEPERNYTQGDILAHVLGYVNEIDKEQLKTREDEGYQMGDRFGQTGLENTFEKYLRGEKGARQVEVDASGRLVNVRGIKEPVSGSSLKLTINSKLQKSAEEALKKGIKKAREGEHEEAEAGAVVALDVNDGSVLAMASYPTFDPGEFGSLTTEEWNKITSQRALQNRALEAYSPGSIFKLVTGTAILENNVVNPDHKITDPGYYKLGNTRFNCWKPEGHGKVDFQKAIQVSCNTYFFQYGREVGQPEITHYAREYRLGEKTGIELPGEKKGTVPSPEYKQEKYDPSSWEYNWHTYDTLNMAIGQGYSEYTPLQLANTVAAIANGGNLYKPYLVKKVISPEGETVKDFKPEIDHKVDASPETLQIIREGMHLATKNYGTAAGVLSGFPLEAAAKTGTAEVAGHDNHALFAAFTPYENPEIAVVVFIKYGGSGSGTAGPVAREILDTYVEINKKSLDIDEETDEENGDD